MDINDHLWLVGFAKWMISTMALIIVIPIAIGIVGTFLIWVFDTVRNIKWNEAHGGTDGRDNQGTSQSD